DRGLDYFHAYVCENLGAPDERVTSGTLDAIAGQRFAEPNILILVRENTRPDRPVDQNRFRLFGNPDEVFEQNKPKRGLLTPAEIRALALAEMDVGPASLVWDVGTGSGSLAVEAAQLARHGRVFAIDMDPQALELTRRNAQRFGLDNLRPVLGQAPEAWASLPDPDAVFVGGTGRQVASLVRAAFARLRPGGRVVAHVASLQNATSAYEALLAQEADPNIWLLQFARGSLHLDQLRFESVNPSFLIGAVKSRW
ncbi:MAG TPA: precorrin-6Y C5,15-methyltransferase (decarboxylating) subunit CbiT, partial [Bryobacterales bacterium]|nr:precorrin-6Y C5,15-methyltransferase (decarboxylating) subunit CbiT [Bryobacterales bacterium]